MIVSKIVLQLEKECVYVSWLLKLKKKLQYTAGYVIRKLEQNNPKRQVCIVEYIPRVHLDFERAICCGFTVFTKGVVFMIEFSSTKINLIFKLHRRHFFSLSTFTL